MVKLGLRACVSVASFCTLKELVMVKQALEDQWEDYSFCTLKKLVILYTQFSTLFIVLKYKEF